MDTREARYIKSLDKVLPKITVILNNAKFFNETNFVNKVQAKQTYDRQRVKLNSLIPDMPEILDMWEYFVEREMSLLND